jgi:hypothetical protein
MKKIALALILVFALSSAALAYHGGGHGHHGGGGHQYHEGPHGEWCGWK